MRHYVTPSSPSTQNTVKSIVKRINICISDLLYSTVRLAVMIFDYIAIFVTLGLFLVYHAYYWISIIDSKKHHSTGISLRNARLWVIKHHSQAHDNSSILLAVHTLRNTILVGIFVGGSSFTFLLETLGPAKLMPESTDIPNFMRVIILGSFFSLSFLCWTTVIRCAVHLGYSIGIIATQREIANIDSTRRSGNSQHLAGEFSEKNFNSTISLMLVSFSLGFRFLFMAMPFVFYVTGPTALIITSIVILFFMIFIDHPYTFLGEFSAPDIQEEGTLA